LNTLRGDAINVYYSSYELSKFSSKAAPTCGGGEGVTSGDSSGANTSNHLPEAIAATKKLINEGYVDAEDRDGKGASSSYHASMEKKRRRKGKEAMRESSLLQAPSFERGRCHGRKSTKAKANRVLLD
jgi:hypothetical protein